MTAIAFYNSTHDDEADLDWQDVDPYLTGFETERGRQSEFDKTEGGTAKLHTEDRGGAFDPTNSTGPFGSVYPLVPAKVEFEHPIASTLHRVFTGYVEEYEYARRGPRSAETTIPLTDGFEVLNQAHAAPAAKGSYFAAQHVDDRILAALADASWPASRTRIATGNVNVQPITYDGGTPLLEVAQEAADAEFPGVANFFMDKDGNAAFSGRGIRFDPDSYPNWVTRWRVGDDGALALDDTLLPIYDLHFVFSKDTIYNDVVSAPRGVSYAAIKNNHVTNSGSITAYGKRSLSLLDLLTLDGSTTGQSGVRECKDFALYYKNNYADPQIRIDSIEFHGQMDDASLGNPLAGALWDFILGVEVTHIVEVHTVHPGGGGLVALDFFVEGITNTVTGLNDVVPRWTMNLNLSPRAVYASYP